LDPATRAELLEVVRGLREAGTSVVMVSHDLEEIAEVADRVCVMAGGKVRAVGSPEETFYADPSEAPATVLTVSILRATRPGIGRPVRYGETLAALKRVLEA
jgi:energy-coupling factor transport system ATP-binding protein